MVRLCGSGSVHHSGAALTARGCRGQGYELSVSPPRVLFGEDDVGRRTEPMEELTLEVDEAQTGMVRGRRGPRHRLSPVARVASPLVSPLVSQLSRASRAARLTSRHPSSPRL